MKRLTITILVLALATTALAQQPIPPKTLTVGQCIDALSGLAALGAKGAMLNEQPGRASPEQYHFRGTTRITIALDIAALQPVLTGAQAAQRDMIAKFTLPAPKKGEAAQLTAEQNKRLGDDLAGIVKAPCPVQVGHLNLADLNVGDDAGQNQIPPPVIAALLPIIDK